jgi:hypothetical protein
MEFLDVIDTIQAEEASVQRLFAGDGTRVRGAHRGPDYARRLTETAKFVAEIYEGRRPLYHLREALGTADFPLLFGDVIDRQLLARYAETQPTYTNYCKVDRSVPDFRTVKRFAIDGSEAVLPSVGQLEEYPESKLSDTVYSYAVGKFGRKVPLMWEAIINDDLGAFRDLPDRLARAARRSEEKFATQLFVDANGPSAAFYTVGNLNKINPTNSGGNFTVVNPSLSITGLQQGFAVLANQRDVDGEPIEIDAIHLVVPPALEVVALNILHATELWIVGDGGGGTANQQVHVANWMRNRLKLSVNYYIPLVASTANGNTSWFLIADPASGRPALEIGFLRGHDTPEIFMKEANSIRVGGGAIDPSQGDFEADAVTYKIRHVFGGAREDFRVTAASNGANA